MTDPKLLKSSTSHAVLTRIFARAVKVAAAASAAAALAVGCADEISLEGFESAPCDMGASTLNPAEGPVDYVAIQGQDPWQGPELLNTAGEHGTACATASDAQTCQEALAAARQEPPWKFLVTTRGDAVERWATREELMTFLGTIDTPGEAVLMAWYDGYTVGCDSLDEGAVKVAGDAYEVIGTKMVSDCAPIETKRFRLRVSPDGTVKVLESEQISYDANSCVGRRPEGLLSAVESCDSTLGHYWSVTTHLEASAVRAFRILADELASYGAPAELVDAARAAAADEVEHTEMTAALAARYGGVRVEPEVEPMPQRDLEAFALDNAVEGCVRETFGAAIGTFQGQHASDPETARIMAQIGLDETRHAHVSWQIAEWLETQLSEDAQARVRTAQRHAIASLRAELRLPVPLELVHEAGLPTPDQAAALFDVLSEELWVG